MLLPMELRTCRDPDAQHQYEPFRNTIFTHRRDDLAAGRGPGALFREEWNCLAGNAQRGSTTRKNPPMFSGSSQDNEASGRGPGSYFPDRYYGAFPALFDKMTPHSVRLEKLEAKRSLAATFGIVPAPDTTNASSIVTIRPARFRASKGSDDSTGHERTFADFPDLSLETTSLSPALTPRNAYQNPANRRVILATCPSGDSAVMTS
ncbi:hypothetical protein PC121_g8191 [Phytophthora cactorum]|nr:hypothetical protein PC120_g6226 [Phytophthora cactorum]KAG3074974.1 hypothetical protein PC121_g8191 [Phytophthora cactorum]KAG4056663.1 hypothetical protein PC123_g8298 [Phytophthora cactorum]